MSWLEQSYGACDTCGTSRAGSLGVHVAGFSGSSEAKLFMTVELGRLGGLLYRILRVI
jgi:hypothetical protein